MQKPTADEFPIRFRIPQDTDIGFITTHWLRETRKFEPRAMPNRVHYAGEQEDIAYLCNRSPALIACPPDDLNYIYGFAVGRVLGSSAAVLHYVYVRPEWEKLGVAGRLVSALGITPEMDVPCSHWSWELDLRRVPRQFWFDKRLLYRDLNRKS